MKVKELSNKEAGKNPFSFASLNDTTFLFILFMQMTSF